MWEANSHCVMDTRMASLFGKSLIEQNRIEVLENSRGERCEEEREIVNILIELYDNLFSSSILV